MTGFNRLSITALRPLGLLAEWNDTSKTPAIVVTALTGDRMSSTGYRETQIGIPGPTYYYESDKFTADTQGLTEASKRRFVQADASGQVVDDAMRAFATRNAALTQAAASDSPSGKLKAAMEAATAALIAIGTGYARLRSLQAEIDATERALFTPPKADAAEAVHDSELRGDLKAMGAGEQLYVLSHLGESKYSRALLAYARYEFPWDHALKNEVMVTTTGDTPQPFGSSSINNAWVARVSDEQPEKVAAYRIRRAMNDWALGVLEQLASIVANASLSGTNGALPPQDVYKILKPTGGVAVMKFDPAEIPMFEYRLQAAA